jgi:hypothetical protein
MFMISDVHDCLDDLDGRGVPDSLDDYDVHAVLGSCDA